MTTKSTFNPALDRELFDAGSIPVTEKVRIHVSVRSYNGAEPSVKVQKKGKKADGSEYVNPFLGGFTANQAALVSLALVSASEFLSRHLKAETTGSAPTATCQPANVEQPATVRTSSRVIKRRPAKQAA